MNSSTLATSGVALTPESPKPRANRAQRGKRVLVWIISIGVFVWAARQCQVSLGDLKEGITRAPAVAAMFFPPDWSAMVEMIHPAAETVLLAALATPLGVAVSLLFGLAGASNVSPPWIRTPARFLIGVERALPEIITLLLLVAALGIGPFPGVLALTIGSVGMLGKLLADSIEEIDPRVIESVRSVGATPWQVVRFAILPEVMPSLLANALFRFEVNIRASILLGAIGAGGIGFELSKAMGVLEYERAMAAVIVTILLVFSAEQFSTRLRSKLLSGGRLK